jgi:HAE1 family hydrophobic/amphiphilic exporter-1
LRSRGISLPRCKSAIVAQATSNTPLGIIAGPKQNMTIDMGMQQADATKYQDIIVAWRNGAPVKLSDIAIVENGVENERIAGWYNDTRSINLAIYRQPDANTIDVVDRREAAAARISRLRSRRDRHRSADGPLRFDP